MPGHGLLDLQRGGHHSFAHDHGEQHEQRHDTQHDQRQLPLDGEHDSKGADQSDDRDKQILRAMVRQFRNFKQVVGHPTHQLASAVLVIEAEGELLHMGEQILTDIRLNAYPHQMAQIGDHKIHPRPQYIGQQKDDHHGKEGGEGALGQQAFHGELGNIGKGQIHQGDTQSTGHIGQEQGDVRPVIGDKDGQLAS